MRQESATIAVRSPLDWKALGYLVSSVSVLFLGTVAWPKPGAPWWHLPALIFGMAASIVGMACRYKAHRDEKREIRDAQAEAREA
jgi:hypothetical protein